VPAAIMIVQVPAEREALEGMIQNFGQVPSQLLKEPHPQVSWLITPLELLNILNPSQLLKEPQPQVSW